MARKARTRRNPRSSSGYSPVLVASRVRGLIGIDSVRQVAALTGVSHETVRRCLVHGRPSPQLLHALCWHYGVSADWVLGLDRGGRGRLRRRSS